MSNDLEQWRIIAKYPRYECSTLGQFRNARTGKIKGTVVNSRTNRRMVKLYNGHRRVCVYAAHIIAETWIGPRPEGMQVDHISGDKTDESGSNLRYCSQSMNVQSSYNNGQHPVRASRQGFLSQADYDQIRAQFKEGQTQVAIGKTWGITNGTVSKIVNFKIKPRIYYRKPRPPTRAEILESHLQKARHLLSMGLSKSQLVIAMGVSKGTAHNYKVAIRKQDAAKV